MTRHDEIVADLERQRRQIAHQEQGEALLAILEKARILPSALEEDGYPRPRTHEGPAPSPRPDGLIRRGLIYYD